MPLGIYVRHPKPIEERFWQHVKKTSTCWLWTGCKTSKSKYGCMNVDGRAIGAHRVALMLCGMDLKDTRDVCHKCDNPPCVRPDHLFIGTTRQNSLDALSKGRLKIRENHGMAKLTEKSVEAIRLLYPTFTQLAIAKFFNVSRGCIGDIIRNKNWKI